MHGGLDLEGLNTLEDACGDDPSWACRRVFEWTDNATLAAIALTDTPLFNATANLIAPPATLAAISPGYVPSALLLMRRRLAA